MRIELDLMVEYRDSSMPMAKLSLITPDGVSHNVWSEYLNRNATDLEEVAVRLISYRLSEALSELVLERR